MARKKAKKKKTSKKINGRSQRSDTIHLTLAQIKLLKKLAGQGLTVSQMSAILDISKKTFERRANENSDVSDAISKGRAQSADAVTQTAYQMAVSGKCPTMTIFWLKTRQRWKETTVNEHTGKDGKELNNTPQVLFYLPGNGRTKEENKKNG